MASSHTPADGSTPVAPKRARRGRRFVAAIAIALAAAAGSAHAALADGVELTLSTNQAAVGQDVSMTATVTSDLGEPDGTVEFVNVDTGMPLNDPLGDALNPVGDGATTTFTFDTSSLPIGTYNIQAQYTVDFLTSLLTGIGNMNSDVQQLAVGSTAPVKSPTVTSLLAPATVATGSPLTLSATVTRTDGSTDIPTGTVEFDDTTSGSNLTLGTAPVDTTGTATLPLPTLNQGTHTIVAYYSGDSQDQASNSTTVLVTSNPPIDTRLKTTTGVVVSPATSASGDTVTITATIDQVGHALQPPGNSVTFISDSQCGLNVNLGSAVLGTAPPGVTVAVNQAAIQTPAFGPCVYTVTASYMGDSANQGSTGTASLTVLGPRDVTQIAYSGDTSTTWNHTASFSATITGMSGAPQVGKTALFTLGAQSCSGTTDTNGFVQCQMVVTQTGAQTLTVSVPKDLFITGRSSTFNFNVATQVTTLATSYQLGLTGTTLSATLSAESSPVANQPVTLSLGSESCGTLLTSGAGTVSCVVPPIVGQDTAALTASFAGTGQYAASSASSNITVIFPTALSYTGPSTAVFGSSLTLSGVLTQTNTNTPLSSRPVTFSLGAQQCTATTDATGGASCTIQPVAADSGSYSVHASYGGDAITKPSNTSASFSVTRAATTTVATSPTAGVSTTSLSAVLTTGGLPVSGKALLLTLGSNACTATTDSTGTGTCSVNTPGGGAATYTATFATDADYTGSSDTKNVILPTTALLYTGPATAVFNSPATLTAQLTKPGDGSPVSGRTVTFTLGTQQCTGTTGSDGVVSCTIAAVTADAGTITLTVAYAGDTSTRPSSISLPFVVTLAPTVTTATAANAGFATTTLNATLTSGGAPVPGKAMTLTLGGNTCLGSTDATGTATCAVSTPIAATATFSAAFAGDAGYAASSDTKTAALPVPTTLAYTGVTTAVFNGSAALSGVLTASSGGVSGKSITFTLGAQQCSATSDATGLASCTIQPVTANAGAVSASATFAGDTSTRPSSASATVSVTSASTTTAAAAPTVGSSATTLSATLTSSGSPLSGKTLTLALGGNSCSAATDATGTASCSVTTPNGGTATYTATFAGDTNYSGSNDGRQVILPTTALVFTGVATAVYNSPAALSAQLTRVGDGSAVADAAVSFTLGSQICQGTTNAVGVASCTIPAVALDPGSAMVLVNFAGDGSSRASTTSASFTVTQAASTTTAIAPTAGTTATTLSATLTGGGAPLAGKPMNLSLGGNTCTTTTDSTGTASCSVATPSGATATYTATFPGDNDFAGSSDSKAVLLPATTLLYSGATTAAFSSSATLTALLSKSGDGSAVSGRVVSFTLGSQSCQGTTGPTGVATCTIAAVTAHAGTTTVAASFAGDETAAASSISVPFIVTLAPTTTVAVSATVGFTSTSLRATLASGATPLAGKPLTLTLGTNSCTASTDATGTAICSVATPIAASAQYTAAFAGDAGYATSAGTKTVALPAPTTLTYTGPTTVVYNGSATLSGLLTLTDDTPLSGKPVSFAFGTLHCTGTTDATGRAACTVQPVTAAAGPYTVGTSFAGDANTRPSGTSAALTVTLAPTVTSAIAPTVGSPSTTLSAVLTSGGSPVSGKALSLDLGGNTCTGTTDASGTATCAVATPGTDSARFTATFAGDSGYATSSDDKTVTIVAPTALAYTGVTTAVFDAPALLSGTLTLADGVTPVSGRTVVFTLGSQSCQATTGANGAASCTIAAVTAVAGSHTVNASYAGDALTKPANDSASFSVSLAPTVTTAATPTPGVGSTTLNATLASGGTPLVGKPMSLTLGGNTCTGTTDATGTATCAVATPTTDSATFTAAFAGDTGYAASGDSKTVALFAATTLAYNGATTAAFNGSAALSAKLTKTADGSALAGRTVSLSLGSQTCQATTNASGLAACAIQPVAQDAGSATASASYVGDAVTKPASDSAPFTITLAPTATVAAAPTIGATTTSLTATLTSSSTPLAGKPMTLALGANSCTATTNTSGVATCSVNTPNGASAQYVASFTADADYASSSDTRTVTLIVPTTLAYTGPTTAVYNAPAALAAKLTLADGSTPLSGRTVAFTLGAQTCQGITGATGVATCSIAAVAADAGPLTVQAAYAGDATTRPATAAAAFSVTPAPTTTAALSPTFLNNTATLSATLVSGGAPLPGEPMTLSLGANACTGTTDSTGTATCSVTIPSGSSATLSATYAGDTDHAASSDAQPVTLVAATTLTYLGQFGAQYHDFAILAATLRTTTNFLPTGQSVTFTLGTQSCTTVTLVGYALCLVHITQPAGSYQVTASFAGTPSYAPATTTAPFTVALDPTYTNAGVVAATSSTTTLNASLSADGAPVTGGAMTLTLGPNSCTATTDANGAATCVVATPNSNSATFTARFAGDGYYAPSSDTETATLPTLTTLTYTGATTAVYGGTATVSAKLNRTGDGALSGRSIAFSLGSQQCSATTSSSGIASCTIHITSGATGATTVTASYGGDSSTRAAAASSPFTVTVAPTVIALGSPTVTSATTALSATLTANRSPLQGEALTLTLGSNACTATTNASGTAGCTVSTPATDTATFAASFAGDGGYAATTASKTVTLLTATSLDYTGATTAVRNGAAVLSATLKKTTGGSPLSSRTITFSLGSQQCSAATNSSGTATCTIQSVSATVGTTTVTASYAGDSTTRAATDSSPFTVTLAPTTVTPQVTAVVLSGSSTQLAGTLTSGTSTLSGRTLTLTLGTASCTATTSSAGVAKCSVTASGPLGPTAVTAAFAGDAAYAASSGTTSTVQYALSTGGTFLVGNRNATGNVTFWGSQWTSSNDLSGTDPSPSFKGFASSPSTPQCGGTWSTGPGNSASPPSGPLPAYMAVAVTSSSGKSGSAITGNITSVVVVKTNAGYDGNPGHAGTGTVVATVC